MSNINENLKKIESAVWGKDVRKAIHDSIHDCYEDGKAGSVDLIARERIDSFTSLKEGSTTGDAELQDIRIGADGKEYPNAGEAVRGQLSELKGDLAQTESRLSESITDIQNVVGKNYIGEIISKSFYGGIHFGFKKGKSYKISLTDSSINITHIMVQRVESVSAVDTVQKLYVGAGIHEKEVVYECADDDAEWLMVRGGTDERGFGVSCKIVQIGGAISDIDTIKTNINSFMANELMINDMEVEPLYDYGIYFEIVDGNSIKVTADYSTSTTGNMFIAFSRGCIINITQDKYGSEWVVPHNNYLVFEPTLKKIEVKNESELIAMNIPFVILMYNSNGFVKGMWSKYTSSNFKVPRYYFDNNYLPRKIDEINSASNITNGVCFAFITDMHVAANALNSKYLLKYIIEHTTVPFVVCGGDLPEVFGSAADLENAAITIVDYQNYIGKDKFFTVRGNHDFYNRDKQGADNRYLSESEIYNVICRNCERYVIDGLPSHMCYVVDNVAQHTRFIMLNSKDATDAVQSLITDDQAQWLCDKLSEKKDWNIIVISHIPIDSAVDDYDENQKVIYDILTAFNRHEYYSARHISSTINGDFTTVSGRVVCHVSGHNHKDLSNASNGLLSITTGCDARYRDDTDRIPLRTLGTIMEQLFDVYCIDFSKRKIKTIRIGAGSNREFTY
ncbi:metallophosphoesterase [Ligilactobacillus ruminis]|uniref:metallophosphoesterase family protein n=1 Tax=Ligilactobacillus ruminis TaxID=1623 RepID=UPI001F25BD9D|nr:metallophosphoesterase [Ligilactobacillus ruminis]MCF2543767.1 metallophosphoesterase [Ligilactobacillus ruminis]